MGRVNAAVHRERQASVSHQQTYWTRDTQPALAKRSAIGITYPSVCPSALASPAMDTGARAPPPSLELVSLHQFGKYFYLYAQLQWAVQW